MLPTGNQKWLPAAEVRGEGIFLELDEAGRSGLGETASRRRANRSSCMRLRGRTDGGEFPGVRFYLLHTLSHLLLTAISLECGYAASAIRERIYSQAGARRASPRWPPCCSGRERPAAKERSAASSRKAAMCATTCAKPGTSAGSAPTTRSARRTTLSHPSSDRRSEGAACHGCLYIAECSCEWYNRFLDRALLVPTIGNDPELAFFKDRP